MDVLMVSLGFSAVLHSFFFLFFFFNRDGRFVILNQFRTHKNLRTARTLKD